MEESREWVAKRRVVRVVLIINGGTRGKTRDQGCCPPNEIIQSGSDPDPSHNQKEGEGKVGACRIGRVGREYEPHKS